MLGLLFDQCVEHLLGLGAVALEEPGLLPLEALRAFPPGAERDVVSQMAEQIEQVGIGLSGRLRQGDEVDTAFITGATISDRRSASSQSRRSLATSG